MDDPINGAKVSLGSRRRWSKASKDGSLSADVAKADIKASTKEISTSPDRGQEENRNGSGASEEGVGTEIIHFTGSQSHGEPLPRPKW